MATTFNHDSVFKGYVDLSKNELRNARVQNVSTPPTTPVTGQLYYDTDDNKLYYWNGTAWIDTTGGSGGIPATTIDAKGDLLVGTAPDTVARKAVGANNTFLAADSAQTDGLLWRVFTDADIPASIMRDSEHTLAAHQELIATNDLTDWPRTASLDLAGQKLTSLGTGVADTDAVNLAQARAILDGHDNKASVRVAAPGNINVASPGGTIDGVTMATNDRFLLPNQTTGSQNGIYVWNGAAVAATRASDADINAEVTAGLTVFVSEGATYANKTFQLFTDDPITLGTTALDFQVISAAGQITAGAGLVKTGDTIDAVAGAAPQTGGPGGGLVVGADSVAVDKNVVVRGYTALFGDGVATSFNIDHNLGTTSVIVQIFLVSTGVTEYCEVARSTVNRVVLSGFATAPAANAYRVMVYSIG